MTSFYLFIYLIIYLLPSCLNNAIPGRGIQTKTALFRRNRIVFCDMYFFVSFGCCLIEIVNEVKEVVVDWHNRENCFLFWYWPELNFTTVNVNKKLKLAGNNGLTVALTSCYGLYSWKDCICLFKMLAFFPCLFCWAACISGIYKFNLSVWKGSHALLAKNFFFFYSWIEAKRFALSQRDVEDIKKCIQDPFTKNKSVGSHKCCYDETWLLCSYADRWRKKSLLSINRINGLWGNFCYLTSEVSYSGSSTTTSVSPGNCAEAISFFNALFDCVKEVIVLNKWKGRSLTRISRSLLRIIAYCSISVATIMTCWF